MKKTLYILLSLAALLSLGGCKHDIEYMLPDDALGFKYTSTVVDVSTFAGSFDVSVVKSGAGRTAASFDITVAEDSLEAYNAANGTEYAALKSIYYTIESNSGKMSAEDVFWLDKISWNIDEITWFVTEGNCVIPLMISSKDTDVNVDRSFILLHIIPTNEYLDDADPVEYFTKATKPAETTYTYENRLYIDAALETTELEFSFTVDNSLVSWYNSNLNGTNATATAAPDGVVTIPDGVKIGIGESGATFKCQVNIDKLYDASGSPIQFDGWVVPVKIKCTTSESVVINNDRFFIRIYPADSEIPDPVGTPKEIWGPWEILEGAGQDIVTEGKADWYGVTNGGTVEMLVDGNLNTEWWSYWDVDNTFPITFVFDLGEQHLFDMLYIADAIRFQGQFRNYRFSTAKVYKGEQTEWKEIASGRRGYDWQDQVNVYECPITNSAAGRYLKFEILNAEWDSGDYIHSHGRLAEIYGHGI